MLLMVTIVKPQKVINEIVTTDRIAFAIIYGRVVMFTIIFPNCKSLSTKYAGDEIYQCQLPVESAKGDQKSHEKYNFKKGKLAVFTGLFVKGSQIGTNDSQDRVEEDIFFPTIFTKAICGRHVAIRIVVKAMMIQVM